MEVAESVKSSRLLMLKVRRWNRSRVKSMTYTMDTCRHLAWRSVLIRYGKDWLAQCRDNVSEWDIESKSRGWPALLAGEQYKVATSAHCHN